MLCANACGEEIQRDLTIAATVAGYLKSGRPEVSGNIGLFKWAD
jgi:hypothetical protein